MGEKFSEGLTSPRAPGSERSLGLGSLTLTLTLKIEESVGLPNFHLKSQKGGNWRIPCRFPNLCPTYVPPRVGSVCGTRRITRGGGADPPPV